MINPSFFAIAFSLIPGVALSAVIFQESFEQEPGVGNYTMNSNSSDGVGDYFLRSSGAGTESYSPLPSNPHGTFFIMAEDTDADGRVDDGIGKVFFPSVDVSSFTNVHVTIALAESLGTVEADDFIQLYASIDGQPDTLIVSFRRPSSSGGVLQEDTDFDGVGDGAALRSDNDFMDFSYAIPGTPSTVKVTLHILMDGPGEEVAADNFRIEGTAVPEPSGPLLLSLGALAVFRRRRPE